MMTLDRALEVAYREAEYVVYVDDQSIVTRIGEPCMPLAKLLEARAVTSAVLLTACNPRSKVLAIADNLARQQALCDELKRLQLDWLNAGGRSTDGRWQEASMLALDLQPEDAHALCLRFEQHAWVSYDAEGCGQLEVTDLPPAPTPAAGGRTR